MSIMSANTQLIRGRSDVSDLDLYNKRNTLYSPLSETYLNDYQDLYCTITSDNMSEKLLNAKHPTLQKLKLEQAMVQIRNLNLEGESSKSTVYSAEGDCKPYKQSVDSELKLEPTNFDNSSSGTELCMQKSTRALEKDSESPFLKVAISILQSLNSDITNSIKTSRKDMYMPKIPGLRSRCSSISGLSEKSPPTSPKKMNTSVVKNLCEKSCLTCSYFDQMDSIYDMQQDLLEFRLQLGALAQNLLEECKKFNNHDSEQIEVIFKAFNEILIEKNIIEEEFEQDDYFCLDPWDAIGAVRLSTQIMYFKYLLMENDKYIQSFKLVQFIMAQLLPGKVCWPNEAVSNYEIES